MNCHGYLSLQDLLVTEAGQPAKEGTACGELLSHMIRQKTETPQVNHAAENGVIFDKDMWFYARGVYRDMLDAAKGSLIETEERIDWMTKSGIKIRGQFDSSYVTGTTLNIDDLKYGFGIVEAPKNWQLLGYAIGQVKRLHDSTGFIPSHISMKIHQPRAHHEDGPLREWVITYAELLEYWQQIEARTMELVQGVKTLTTGKSCKYCEGLNVCPAFNRSYHKTLDTVMDDWKQDNIDNKTIAEQIAMVERAEEILKIKKSSLENLAIDRLKNGNIVPGYSFETSLGNRQWAAGVTVDSMRALTGVDLTKIDMYTPAQAEKLGVSKKLTDLMTTRENRGAKLIKKDVLKEANKIFKKEG